jgi:hypothetical protein
MCCCFTSEFFFPSTATLVPPAMSSCISPSLFLVSLPIRLDRLAAGPAFVSKASLRLHTNQTFTSGFSLSFYYIFRPYSSKRKSKMPPKKVVKEEKILLGRPGNNLKSGIVCENLPVQRVVYVIDAKLVH